MHLAAMSGHNDVVKLLVDRKAFLSVKNEEGREPQSGGLWGEAGTPNWDISAKTWALST